MFAPSRLLVALSAALMVAMPVGPLPGAETPTAADVMKGLKDFWHKTAQPDGSFRPGIDPEYRGMSDSAFSDLAAVTYAVTLHRTFGWKLPHEEKTRAWLLGRQRKDGSFFNVHGTADPATPLARLYNTTQGLVALHALGERPRYDPIPVFTQILEGDYRKLPPYTTSFFPLAYACAGKKLSPEEDRKIRALLVQADDGYVQRHIAATFHAVHYYRLLGEPTPRAEALIARVVRDQKPDGGWLLNPPSWDRHAAFDAVFCLVQVGGDKPEVKKAIRKATAYALASRNTDGGFGHFPGSPSDADAVYFQVGLLVMAGFLEPVSPLPRDPQLLSWGHLMPRPKR
jgi:geranylgeranyl transferase type-2 subunit beta